MREPRVPPFLLHEVAADLAPVRPLWSPLRRTLLLLPVAVLLLVVIPGFWGLRVNADALGPAAAWGLSALQALAGLVIVGAALREAVPGRTLSTWALAVTVAAAGLLFVGITLTTEHVAPTLVPPGVWERFAWECFGMATVSGAPAVALTAWLAARALPTRPWVAGGLSGLGAALVADSGVRLFCWVSTPSHVLVAHGAAVLALACVGAAIAAGAERLKARRARRRR